MKKIKLFIFLLFIGLIFSSNAQKISENALGLRLGDNDGFGWEISYQRALSSKNRLEANLGWRNSNQVDAFKLTGLYQWVWNIDGNFNWYTGLGGGLGSWKSKDFDVNGTFVYLAGNLGIEYGFEQVPVLLSLDIRPELYFNSDDYRTDNLGPDIALGIRYQF